MKNAVCLQRAPRVGVCACLLIISVTRAVWGQAVVTERDTSSDRRLTTTSLQEFIDPFVIGQLERRKIAGAVVVVVKDGAIV